jgi:hypothetical protein
VTAQPVAAIQILPPLPSHRVAALAPAADRDARRAPFSPPPRPAAPVFEAGDERIMPLTASAPLSVATFIAQQVVQECMAPAAPDPQAAAAYARTDMVLTRQSLMAIAV